MQVNLEREAPPTVTQPQQKSNAGYNTAAYVLAFTVTVASTVAHGEYHERMTIGPASLSASADRTNAVWFEEDMRGADGSWLSKTISELHAGISDKAWEDVPDTSNLDFDSIL